MEQMALLSSIAASLDLLSFEPALSRRILTRYGPSKNLFFAFSSFYTRATTQAAGEFAMLKRYIRQKSSHLGMERILNLAKPCRIPIVSAV